MVRRQWRQFHGPDERELKYGKHQPYDRHSRRRILGPDRHIAGDDDRIGAMTSEQPRSAAAEQCKANDARAKNVESSSPNKSFSSATPPAAPTGLSSGLQPGGTIPGGGPPASVGSIGTGGGQTEGNDSGSKKRGGR